MRKQKQDVNNGIHDDVHIDNYGVDEPKEMSREGGSINATDP